MPELDTEFDERTYFHKRRQQIKRADRAEQFNSQSPDTAAAKSKLKVARNKAAEKLKQARIEAEKLEQEISQIDDALEALDKKPSKKQTKPSSRPKGGLWA
jgi:K+-transporting ATPase c subunit